MPEKEYRTICANCGDTETKKIRVLRFSKEDKRRWDKVTHKLESGFGFMAGLLGFLFTVMILLALLFPKFPPFTNGVENPIQPAYRSFVVSTSGILLGKLIPQDKGAREMLFVGLLGCIYLVVYIPYAIKRGRRLKRKKKALLALYDFEENGKEYVVDVK